MENTVNFSEALVANETKRVRIANGKSDWLKVNELVEQKEFTSACVKHRWEVEPQKVEFIGQICAHNRVNGHLTSIKIETIGDEIGAYIIKEGISFKKVKVTIELAE